MTEHAAQEEAQRRVSNEARRKAAADEGAACGGPGCPCRSRDEAGGRGGQATQPAGEAQAREAEDAGEGEADCDARDAAARCRGDGAKALRGRAAREALAKREARLRELAEAARPPVAKATVRDTERLTRPTQAHAVRRHEIASARRMGADDVPSRFGSSSLTFAAAGSRAVPAWRAAASEEPVLRSRAARALSSRRDAPRSHTQLAQRPQRQLCSMIVGN